MTTRGTPEPSSAVISTEDGHLVIRIPIPDAAAGVGAQLTFAARSESLDGPLLWARFRAARRALAERLVEDDGRAAGVNGVFDPHTTIAAEYSVAAHLSQGRAEGFIDRADDCFTRIPRVGECLRDALITPRLFDSLRHETALVEDDEVLADVDTTIATWIRGHGRGSVNRVSEAARRIVARRDADAARRRDDARKVFKNAGAVPLDGRLSKFVVTADVEDVRLSQEVVQAVAAGVCEQDPRTTGERRADAATALLQRKQFTCRCGNRDCPAATSETEVAARCARIVLHVVVRQETVDGESTLPAYMDGEGPVAADRIQELRRRPDVREQPLDLGELFTATARDKTPHDPTTTCATVVRALFGRCSWPGCERAAYRCDLDHVCEFNEREPAAGGATCFCNLNPKCRFHHLLKTTLDEWIDDQRIDADGTVWTEVVTPSGIASSMPAGNSWLLPEIGSIPCRHGPPRVPGIREATDPQRSCTRTEAKHRYRVAKRAANRAARERRRAERVAASADCGEPPY